MNHDDALIRALIRAEESTTLGRRCQACDAIEQVGDTAKEPLRHALAGSIGNDRLSRILTSLGYKVGRRAIIRHRTEGHS